MMTPIRILTALCFLTMFTFATPRCVAAPVVTGAYQVVGLGVAGLSGGTASIGRSPGVTLDTNLTNVATTIGLPVSAINSLNGGGLAVRGSALYNTFQGASAGDSILFSAQRILTLTSSGVEFDYFASFVQVGDPTTFGVRALPLTNTLQQFSLVLPESGDYLVAFGAVRTNPGGFLATYGTTAVFSAITPAPELDPASAAIPAALCCGMLLLAADKRRRHPHSPAFSA